VELSITNYKTWTLGEEPHGHKASERCKQGSWPTFDLCAAETDRESADAKIILEVDCTLKPCLMSEDKP
jgi:hypothetical protein